MANKQQSIAAAWAKLDAARGSTKPKAATAAAIVKLVKQVGALPPGLAESLAVHDGGIHLDSYDLLSTKHIPSWTESARELGAGLVAVAADSGGNVYALDKRGKLIGVERQGPRGTFVKAKSLRDWLRAVTEGIAGGTLVVDAGSIVEAVTPPSLEAEEDTTQRIEHPFADKVQKLIDTGDVAGLKKLIVAKKVEPSAHFWTDASLIAQAAEARQLAIVKLLLDRGCPVDLGAAQGKRTALFTACWGMADGQRLVDELLARGADPNAQTSYDGTPLHSAIMWEHVALVKRLVAAGADPKKTDAKGKSAIDHAKKLKGTLRTDVLAGLKIR